MLLPIHGQATIICIHVHLKTTHVMVYQVSDIHVSYLVIHFVRCAHYVKLDSQCAKITKFGQLLRGIIRVTLF